MIATGVANVINIILNLVLVKLGLGVVGIALATTISRAINVVILLIRLKRGKDGG